MKTVAFAMMLSIVPSIANAWSGWYYAGVSRTADVAHYTTATMQFSTLPPFSSCGVSCHVLGWTILADSGSFNHYVEAGVGCEPGTHHPCDQQWLWWTNQKKKTAQFIRSIPLGTPVKVEITKIDGQNYAKAEWSWPGGYRTKQIALGKWYVGAAIHPTQLEVYVYNKPSFPSPLAFSATGINIYPEDSASAYLYDQSPLDAIGTLEGYTVTLP